MGPAVGIPAGKPIVPVVAEQPANGDMHEILLLFFVECGFPSSQFLDADEEKHRVQVW